MKTIDYCQGKWLEVFQFYGLPHIVSLKHVECPLCGKRNFRIDNKQGTGSYICTCSSGYGMQLIIEATGKDFKEVAKEIDKEFGNYTPEIPTGEFTRKDDFIPSKQEQILTRFSSIGRIEGTPVQEYLNGRGIYTLPTSSIKFSKAEFDRENNRSFQTMYSIATDDHMNIIYNHKTFLENGKKADVTRNKKIYSALDNKVVCTSCGSTSSQSCAIRLFEAGETLGISEGIETALSATQLSKIPCWSVINTAVMKVFKAPKGVKTLVIFADNDKNGAGLAAAMVCANKNVLANNDVNQVFIRWTEDAGVDFNDMLAMKNKKYLELKIG
jgi:putative DNA primase/helicase